MIFIWKNRGILVPVYPVVTIVFIILALGLIKRYVTDSFHVEFTFLLSIAMFLSGIWTYLTCEDYVIVDGKKLKVDIVNSFFYIPMKIWSYIYLVLGFITLLSGIQKM